MFETLRTHTDLQDLLERQSGILLSSDLEAFWGNRDAFLLHDRINVWIELGTLRSVCRGVYVGKRFDPWSLAQRMYPDSVVSTVSVLSRHALVGTAPSEQAWCVRAGRSRDIGSGGIAVHAWSQDASLVDLGWEWQGAVRVARPEKAFLDTLYFHLHGRAYPFSVPQDIDASGLSRPFLEELLPLYPNIRFRAFARGVINAA
jgi:hypothetical protein